MITVFRDAWIVTQNADRAIVKGDLVVDGERIAQVGGKYNGTGDEEFDCSGDVLMPGMVDTHTHIAMTVMKGVVDDLTFPDFLDKTFKIDADRTPHDLSVGTKLGAIEMMRSATTTFVDLYYDEDVIAKASQQAGIRGVCSWCCLDEDKTTQKGKPTDNARRFHERFKGERKVIPAVGLQGVYCCSEETCLEAKDIAEEFGVPLNMHVSETLGEVNNHKRATGKRPVEWLDSIGALTPRMTAAHSNWLTMREVRMFRDHGVNVSTCPASNMKLASGACPVPEFYGNGVNVSLGTDGSTTNNTLDMIAEMRLAGLLQKVSYMDPTVAPAQYMLDMATVNGAKAIGMEKDLGSLEPGKYADVVVIDGKSAGIRPLLPENMVANLAYSLTSSAVKTVMCQGDVVLRDRKVQALDEEEVLSQSEDCWRQLCLRRARARGYSSSPRTYRGCARGASRPSTCTSTPTSPIRTPRSRAR